MRKFHVLHTDFDKWPLGSKWLLDIKYHLIQYYFLLVITNYSLKLACSSGARDNLLTKQKVTSKYLPQKIVLVGSWKHFVHSIPVSRENHFGTLLYWFSASVISISADFKVTLIKLSILNPACFHQNTYWKFLV